MHAIVPRIVLAAVALGLGTGGLAAQRLTSFATPRGVEVRIVDLSYDIQGNTARALLDQMRDGGWVQLPYEYRWRYGTRRLGSVSGRSTLHCGVTDLTVEFTVRADYPRWANRPADASPRLLEAWALFEEQLEAFWEERRDAMVRFARDAQREVERIEEGCPIIQQIVNDRVERAHDRAMRREAEAREDGERTRLRWPPQGYEDLMAAQREARSSPPRPAFEGARPSTPGGSTPAGGRRPPPLPPEGRNAPGGGEVGIERVLVSDVGPGAMLGAVAGLMIDGEVDYLGASGSPAFDESADRLLPDAPARLPGLTHVVLSALVTALEADGALDVDAPIRSYLDDLSPRLGAIPLRSLLDGRSGLDDARPRDSVWSRVLDDLDDRAVFTEAGVVDSYSRYDLPMAIRTIEAATGVTVADLATRRVFEPVGMDATLLQPSETGVPLTVTTAEDLLALGAALAAGQLHLVPEADIEERWSDASAGGGMRVGGMRWDAPVDIRRMTLMCEAGAGTDAVAFQLYPDHDVVQILWARPRSSAQVWPATVARLVLEDLGSKLGLGPAVFEPRRLRGAADLQTDPTLCDEPDWNPESVVQAGDPADPDDWPGTYTNGDRRVTVEARDGALWLTDDTPLRVASYEGDVHFATLNDIALYPLRLLRDAEGRRYIVLHRRAYLHDDDR